MLLGTPRSSGWLMRMKTDAEGRLACRKKTGGAALPLRPKVTSETARHPRACDASASSRAAPRASFSPNRGELCAELPNNDATHDSQIHSTRASRAPDGRSTSLHDALRLVRRARSKQYSRQQRKLDDAYSYPPP